MLWVVTVTNLPAEGARPPRFLQRRKRRPLTQPSVSWHRSLHRAACLRPGM